MRGRCSTVWQSLFYTSREREREAERSGKSSKCLERTIALYRFTILDRLTSLTAAPNLDFTDEALESPRVTSSERTKFELFQVSFEISL